MHFNQNVRTQDHPNSTQSNPSTNKINLNLNNFGNTNQQQNQVMSDSIINTYSEFHSANNSINNNNSNQNNNNNNSPIHQFNSTQQNNNPSLIIDQLK